MAYKLFPVCGTVVYDTINAIATVTNAVSKSQLEQNRNTNMLKAVSVVDKGECFQTAAIKF